MIALSGLSFGILVYRKRIGSRLRHSLSGLGSPARTLPPVNEEDGVGEVDFVGEETDSKPQEVVVELHEEKEEEREWPEEGQGNESPGVGPIPISTGPDPMETEL